MYRLSKLWFHSLPLLRGVWEWGREREREFNVVSLLDDKKSTHSTWRKRKTNDIHSNKLLLLWEAARWQVQNTIGQCKWLLRKAPFFSISPFVSNKALLYFDFLCVNFVIFFFFVPQFGLFIHCSNIRCTTRHEKFWRIQLKTVHECFPFARVPCVCCEQKKCLFRSVNAITYR